MERTGVKHSEEATEVVAEAVAEDLGALNRQVAELKQKEGKIIEHSDGVIPPLPPPPPLSDLATAAEGVAEARANEEPGLALERVKKVLNLLIDVEPLRGAAFKFIARCKECGWQTMQMSEDQGEQLVVQHAMKHWPEIRAKVSSAEPVVGAEARPVVRPAHPVHGHAQRQP